MAKKEKIITLVVALLLALMLIFFSGAKVVLSARAAVFWALKPLVLAAERVRFISGSAAFSRNEVVELVGDSQRLRASNVELEKLRSENQALKKVMGFSQNSGLSLKGAEVVLYTHESGREFLQIGAGKDDGVREGDLVIDENLIFVGMVRETGVTSAKVVSASSLGENIEVELIPSKIRALAKGLGARALRLELVPSGTALRRGDLAVLASSQGRYPFAVGEIVREKPAGSGAFKEVNITHLARPELLRKVFIVFSRP